MVIGVSFQTISFTQLIVGEGESVIAAILKLFHHINIPACEVLKDYGLCKSNHKAMFIHCLKDVERFFQSNSRFVAINRPFH